MFSHIELGYLSGGKRTLCRFTGVRKDQFSADLEIDDAGLRLGRRLFVDLKTPEAAELLHFKIELNPSLSESKRMMVNGFQSWSGSGEMSPSHRLPPLFMAAYPFLGPYGDYRLHRYSGRRGHLHSWTYTYFITGGGEILLLGSLDEGAGYTLFDYDYRRDRLIISRDCEGALCSGSYPLLRLYMGRGKPRAVMDEYFRAMGLSHKRSPRVTGWCSWYNYYTHVTGDDIEHNLEALSDLGLPFDYFQIDDGWQRAIGDWLEHNAKFPLGMKKVADRISARGFQPGLWLAPLICERRSQLFREKKEWLLRDSRGRPVKGGYNPGWSGWFYALDFYAPGFQDYLRRVFRQLKDEWGYRLFKLDFLFAAALLPRQGRSRGAVMAEVMEFLREQAGESKLLGCGVPLGPAMGRVDYCRIGADVYESWDLPLKGLSIRERLSTGNSLLSTIGRHHLDGRAFRNDPDVFILRDGLRGKNLNRLTHHQRGSLFFLNQLLGGLVFFSDDPAEYTAEQRQQLRSAFPAVEVLIDGVENCDGFYRIEFTARRRRYLALANLTGRSREVTLEGGPYFHPRRFVLPRGRTITLAPFETLSLLAIEAREEKPYLLGATGHIYPGAQIEKLILRRGSVTLRLHEQARADSRIFLAVPRDTVNLRVNGIERPVTLKDGIHFAAVEPRAGR